MIGGHHLEKEKHNMMIHYYTITYIPVHTQTNTQTYQMI